MIALIFFYTLTTLLSVALFKMLSTKLEKFILIFVFVISTSIVGIKSIQNYKENPKCFDSMVNDISSCSSIVGQDKFG